MNWNRDIKIHWILIAGVVLVAIAVAAAYYTAAWKDNAAVGVDVHVKHLGLPNLGR